MFRKTAAVVAIGLMCVAGQASAAASIASVEAGKSSVMVNQGGAFAPVTSSTALKAGDRVVAMNGATSVSYADGCVVSVAPQAMVTIGEKSPCSASLVQGSQNASFFELGGFGGAALIFGIGLLAIALAYDNDDEPVSP